MDVYLSKQIKMFARENQDHNHVEFDEGTYDDTVVVRSEYEGVLLELVDRLDDEGYYVYYDRYDNAIQTADDEKFEITVCQHNAHPNYS